MFLSSPLLNRCAGVVHGWCGIPDGSPESFSSEEEAMRFRPINLDKNLKSLGMKGGVPVLLTQTHSVDVHLVTEEFLRSYDREKAPEGDALVTALSNVVLGVRTADCAPLLWCEKEKGLIAATHAGWRGALGGVVEATLEAMLRLGARREAVCVALGPMITVRNYEVDQAFFDSFVAKCADYEMFFMQHADKLFFDLPAFLLTKLSKLGVQYENLALDTFSGPFYSRRRSCKNKRTYGSNYGLVVRK